MLAILYLAVYLFCGCVIVRALLPRKSVLARVWIGLCLGVLLMMWLPALMAFIFKFSVTGHMLALLPLCGLTLGAWFLRSRTVARGWDQGEQKTLYLLLFIALPLTLLGGYLQYTHCLRPEDGALNVGQSTYGDLPLHLGIITSLRNARFPADYNILPGEMLSYPFLMDSFSTSFMLFGLPLRLAVIVPGTLLMALTFGGYIILSARMTSGRRAAALAALFVFINGGLGFLYSLDTLGVSNGTAGENALQSGTWLERLDTILHGWYQTPANHDAQSYYNLRWSNIIADMLIPQRTFLGGISLLLPCIYLLYDGVSQSALRARGESAPRCDYRQTALLGVMAGGLPLLHTHSFLALGLLSAGWMVYDLLRGGKPWPWLVYGGFACALAAPQLLLWTFRHTAGNQAFVYFQFNWVNNAGGQGLRDGYFIFYIKNIGVPFVLLLLSLLEKNRRRRFIASGAFVIFLVSEFIVFQPNEYDNNKLFYVWWMLCAVLAADYALELFSRLSGLRARYAIAALGAVLCFSTGTLSLARECVSDYQMFSQTDVETAAFVEQNTPADSTFLCWTQHINPVSALAGRKIVCGPALWLHWHGFNLSEREADIARFYNDPRGSADVLDKYDVDYIVIGSYESANTQVDRSLMAALYSLVYQSADGSVQIFSVLPAAEGQHG